MCDVRVDVEEVSNRVDCFPSKTVNFQIDMIVGEPFHHGMVFQGGFLEVQDRFCTEYAASDGNFVAVYQLFWGRVHKEKLFEFCFFHRKGIMSWVEKVIIGKGMHCNVWIMPDPLQEEVFHAAGRVEHGAGLSQ